MLLLREDLDYIGRNGEQLFSPLERKVWDRIFRENPIPKLPV